MSTGTTSTNSPHGETVRSIYDAFGRGDIPAILDRLAEDVRWEPWADSFAQRAGVPWLQARHGRAGAGEFFRAVSELEITEFSVLDIMTSGDQVAAEVMIDARTPSGGRYRDEELHLWSFDAAGQVECATTLTRPSTSPPRAGKTPQAETRTRPPLATSKQATGPPQSARRRSANVDSTSAGRDTKAGPGRERPEPQARWLRKGQHVDTCGPSASHFSGWRSGSRISKRWPAPYERTHRQRVRSPGQQEATASVSMPLES